METFALVMALAVAAGLVHEGVFAVHHAFRCDDHKCHCAFSHRWLAGGTLNGRVVTDAGWRTRATKPLTRTGHAPRFQKLPGWKRRAWRTGGTYTVFAVAVGLVLDAQATILALVLAIVAGVTAAVLLGVRWWRRRPHQREFVQPWHVRLAPVCQVALSEKPSKWLEVPVSRKTAVIHLPVGLDVTPKMLETAERETVRTLGLPAGTEMTSHLQGARRELRFQVVEPPPPLVLLDPDPSRHAPGIREAIMGCEWHEVIVGYGVRGELIKVSLKKDVPHWGMSMPTGDGKSVAAELFAAQMAFHGAVILILDYKLFSHPWALFKMPNVHYAGRIEQIHLALLWLDQEIEKRKDRALDGIDVTGEFHGDIGPVLFVVVEEMNTLKDQLKAYWKEIGGVGPSPAILALHKAMFIGRGLLIHMLLIAQKLLATTAGGTDGSVIENCAGLLIGGNASTSVWRTRAEDVVRPPKQSHRGRHYVVAGGTVDLVQVAFLNPKGRPGPEARQMALAGMVTRFPDGVPEGIAKPVTAVSGGGPRPVTPTWGNGGVTGTNRRLVLPPGSSGLPVTPADEADIRDTPISLREAVKRGIVRCSLAAIKQDRWRDPDFPKAAPGHEGPRGELRYWPADLFSYDASKRG
jgi:hypothetical protein